MNALRVFSVFVVLAVLGLAAAWYWRSRPERAIIGAPLTGEITIDDFGFTVLSSREADALGASGARVEAHGVFKIVTLRVKNHARRVDFRFETRIARLVAENGDEYVVSPEGQAALEAVGPQLPAHAVSIHAGASCETEVVFDVPREPTTFTFRVCFLPGILDALDVVMYGNQRIKME